MTTPSNPASTIAIRACHNQETPLAVVVDAAEVAELLKEVVTNFLVMRMTIFLRRFSDPEGIGDPIQLNSLPLRLVEHWFYDYNSSQWYCGKSGLQDKMQLTSYCCISSGNKDTKYL